MMSSPHLSMSTTPLIPCTPPNLPLGSAKGGVEPHPVLGRGSFVRVMGFWGLTLINPFLLSFRVVQFEGAPDLMGVAGMRKSERG